MHSAFLLQINWSPEQETRPHRQAGANSGVLIPHPMLFQLPWLEREHMHGPRLQGHSYNLSCFGTCPTALNQFLFPGQIKCHLFREVYFVLPLPRSDQSLLILCHHFSPSLDLPITPQFSQSVINFIIHPMSLPLDWKLLDGWVHPSTHLFTPNLLHPTHLHMFIKRLIYPTNIYNAPTSCHGLHGGCIRDRDRHWTCPMQFALLKESHRIIQIILMGDTHQPGDNVRYLTGKEHQGQVTGNSNAPCERFPTWTCTSGNILYVL